MQTELTEARRNLREAQTNLHALVIEGAEESELRNARHIIELRQIDCYNISHNPADMPACWNSGV